LVSDLKRTSSGIQACYVARDNNCRYTDPNE
jgi:hypothetical protein